MKEGWEYSNIGDLCDKINGLWKGKTGPFVNVGVIRNANFTKSFTLSFDNIEYLDVEAKQYKTRKLQKGDLIVEKSGGSEKQPVGRTVLFDREEGEYSFSNFTSVLRIKDREVISPEFLYKYILFVYLRGDTRKMQKATTGIHNIEFDKFLSIPVPKIPLSEQQSIVDYLDSAFAKIDAMKANAEKALNEAKALFQASLKEMLEPKEGWEENMLGDLVSFFSGYAFESKRYTNNNDDILLICGDNIVHCDFRWETIKHWPKEEYEDLKRFSLEKNDIVLAMDRPWVKSGLKIAKITPKELPSLLIQRTACIRTPKDISSDFVFYALQTEKFIKHLVSQQNGVGVPHISGKQILSYKISIPKYVEQQSIVATLDSLKSKVDRLQANFDKISQECDALKQAILRQVFE